MGRKERNITRAKALMNSIATDLEKWSNLMKIISTIDEETKSAVQQFYSAIQKMAHPDFLDNPLPSLQDNKRSYATKLTPPRVEPSPTNRTIRKRRCTISEASVVHHDEDDYGEIDDILAEVSRDNTEERKQEILAELFPSFSDDPIDPLSLGFDLSGLETIDLLSSPTQKEKTEGTTAPAPNEAPTTADDLGFDLDGLDASILMDIEKSDDTAPVDRNLAPKHSTPIADDLGFDLGGLDDFSDTNYDNIILPSEENTNANSLGFDLSGLEDCSFLPDVTPPQESKSVVDSLDFDLGDLSSSNFFTAPSTGQIDSKTTEKVSYDAFMATLHPEKSLTGKELSPRGNRLLRDIGLREDMNKRGMKRIKKKSVATSLNPRGLYQMEDMNYIGFPFQEDNSVALLAIFDGHADKFAAESAKAVLPKLFGKHMATAPLGDNNEDVLKQLFKDIDHHLIEFETEGTTATVVIIWKIGSSRYIQSANVGDSTPFLCRNGKAVALGVDHKVNDPGEMERMRSLGMTINPGQTRVNGLALSRTLGDHFIKQNFIGVTGEPYVSENILLHETDTQLILASDGLWDVMTGQEALEMIQHCGNPTDMATKLIKTATSSAKCTDNITVIVVAL